MKCNKTKMMVIASFCMLAVSVVALVAVTVSWFTSQRKMSTVVWVKTPMFLDIGSGNNQDIKFLDLGDIDVKTQNSKDYVFCVYGSPVDNYSLQLAYTTNIDFTYTIYRAEMTGADTDIPSYYDGGVDYFAKASDTAIITGLPLSQLGDDAAKHQSHRMSYGDEYGNLPEDDTFLGKVQVNAEPLYWLAQEAGTSILRPSNILSENGDSYFLDYYILHISWGDNVTNDKETDIVYLTASR